MSRVHQKTDEVRQILRDIKHCLPDELLSLHGIEILTCGKVIDHTYNITYASIDDWVDSTDDDDAFEKFSKYYDEEH